MISVDYVQRQPFTSAVRQALQGINNSTIEADYLFLEAWEMHPSSHLGVTLRASQIRRANPALAAAIDAELKGGALLSRSGPPVAGKASVAGEGNLSKSQKATDAANGGRLATRASA